MGYLWRPTILKSGEYEYFSPVSVHNYFTFSIDVPQEISIIGEDKFGFGIQVIIYDSNLEYVTEYVGSNLSNSYLELPGTYYAHVIDSYGGGFKITFNDFYQDNTDNNQVDQDMIPILQLYTSYFNRAADSEGVDYWLNEIEVNNWTLDTVSKTFAQQEEFIALYSGLSSVETVEKVYLNTLNRQVDSGGLEYWSNELDNGNINITQLIQAIVNAALETDENDNYINLDDATILNNKTEVSLYYYKNNLQETNFTLESITTEYSTVTLQKNEISNLLIASVNYDDYSVVNQLTSEFSLNKEIQSVLSGSYWYDSIISYNFNETLPTLDNDYDDSLYSGFTPLNTQQREAVRDIFIQIESIIDLQFNEVNSFGDIKFNIINFEGDLAEYGGYAYYPNEVYDLAGDVFLNIDYFYNKDFIQGNYEWATVVHEIGHALGLEHPFEGDTILDEELDSVQSTVMSYTEPNSAVPIFSGNYVDYDRVLPSLYSIYDIAALQLIYGANSNTNIEDTTYSFNYNNPEYFTIWDAGGIDTIDLSDNLGDTTLDLNSGTLNSVDEYSLNEIIEKYQNENRNINSGFIENEITYLYEEELMFTGKNNIGIAYGTVIENIYTGSGNDKVIDNEVDNIIKTSSGIDIITIGNGGMDTIDAGEGLDYLDVLYRESQVTIKQLEEDQYLLFSDDYLATVENIEFVKFTDSLNYQSIDLLVL